MFVDPVIINTAFSYLEYSINWLLLKLCNSIQPNIWYLWYLEKLAIKMWFLINFAKTLKDCYFVVGGSKNLKLSTKVSFSFGLQNYVLSSFLLFLSVYYQDDLSDSERKEITSLTARNFNNNWLLYVKFFRDNKPLRKYLTDWKLKMSAIFIFEIKGAKKNKIFNLLKGCFSVMCGPMNMIFGMFLETYVRLLISITSQFFSRCSKSYNNLNVKSCLKLNFP